MDYQYCGVRGDAFPAVAAEVCVGAVHRLIFPGVYHHYYGVGDIPEISVA